MDWKELLKSRKDKMIWVAVFAMIAIIITMFGFWIILSGLSGTETEYMVAFRAVAAAQCAKYNETDCTGKIVTADSCQFTCTFDKALKRCKPTIPGMPLPNAPAGTTC